MVDLNGHKAGNGGYSQRKPTALRDSSTRKPGVVRLRHRSGFVVNSWANPGGSTITAKSLKQGSSIGIPVRLRRHKVDQGLLIGLLRA
jgi:hypothetical protein